MNGINNFGMMFGMGAMTGMTGMAGFNMSISIGAPSEMTGMMDCFSPSLPALGNIPSSMAGMCGFPCVGQMGGLGLGMIPGFGGACNIGGSLFGNLSSTRQMTNMMMSMISMMSEMTNQQFMNDLQKLSSSLSANGYSGGAGNVGGYGSSQSGNAVAALAEKFLGRDSYSIKGELPHFTAAGGRNNNCADFVCSLLESNGMISKHIVGVKSLEKQLKAEGWKQVSADQAQPGDVWISDSRGHTEIVEKAGKPPTLIGSNNNGDHIQEITRAKKTSGVYYHKP